ncbi:MAG: 30S ribosomal protein S3 [Candidatus Methanomethylicia archaeon]
MMNIKRYFVQERYNQMQINEYLMREFERAGYAGMEMYKTPLGMRITIYAERPGMIIGRGGATIKKLSDVLEKRFGVERPQIAIAQIQTPELNAKVMALRIARAMERGVNFRRAAFVALRQIMDAGAKGAEIIISGKLRSERANYEKVKAGDLLKTGEMRGILVDEGKAEVLLKPGIYGVKVRIMPPAKLPDEIMIKEKVELKEEE